MLKPKIKDRGDLINEQMKTEPSEKQIILVDSFSAKRYQRVQTNPIWPNCLTGSKPLHSEAKSRAKLED